LRHPIIAGNWKMFKKIAETGDFFKQFVPLVSSVTHCDIVVAPPFTALAAAAAAAAGSKVSISAQDVYFENEGAFTGEVSIPMLLDAGCRYTIVGHSERRQFFGETDGTVNKKARASVNGGLKVIVCVGETLAERDSGQAETVVRRQVVNALAELTQSDLSSIIVAYEPVWAIGTGRTATPDTAATMHGGIRKIIEQTFGAKAAEDIRILYGGSVKPNNISELMQREDIDGALVGGASLEPASFAAIVNYL
jgi:triosephosphate isomerase (TIM)